MLNGTNSPSNQFPSEYPEPATTEKNVKTGRVLGKRVGDINLDQDADRVNYHTGSEKKPSIYEEMIIKANNYRNYKTTVATKSINLEQRPDQKTRPVLKSQGNNRNGQQIRSPQNNNQKEYFISKPKVSARDPLYTSSST